MSKYPNLARPIDIGKVFIKNRIAMAPMNDLHQFYDPVEGTINQRWIEYFTERARGGVGLIITGVFKVEDEITHFRQNGWATWALLKRKSMQNYAELAKIVHTYGGRIFMQITAGPGRVAGGPAIDQGHVPISPSPNQAYFRPEVTCRELATEEVVRLVEAFGEGAEIVRDSGFDGVEVHGHEGYLIDQFTTALWNRRTDKYGGDVRGRMTFPVEILEAIRRRAGDDFAVIYRYGSKHFIKGPWQGALRTGETELGRDFKDSIQMAKILEEAGYDALHIDCGAYESAYWAHPPYYLPNGFSADWTAQIKREVNIPVIAVGRMGVAEVAEKTLAEGKADMIALGRDLLSDPYWPKKVLSGHEEDALLCIGCHDCMYRAETMQYLTCAVNPFCGNESVYKLEPTAMPKKIMIAGGGVGGMAAARICTLRGHEVALYEKSGELGGHLIAGGAPDFKKDIIVFLDWYKRQMETLGINIKYNTAVTPDLVQSENPDVVIVATGSSHIIPDIPGLDQPHVATGIDILLGRKQAGETVVMVGGGVEGSETALWLAQQGKKVTILEMLAELQLDIHRANKDMLLNLLVDQQVNIVTNTKATSIEGDGVTALNVQRNTVKYPCDTVVLSVGLKPENQLYRSLLDGNGGRELYDIGDCKKPRKISDAVWEAYMLALTI